jgi:Uma2 family endonuclease
MINTLITVNEYYEVGASYANTELIQGQVIPMSPIGAKHAMIVSYLGQMMAQQIYQTFIERLHLRQQNPVRLSSFSEPQPDITIVKHYPDFYSAQHPRPEDIYLIIEVADSTISYDLEVKVPLYASVSIPEVWVIDTQLQQCIVHRHPLSNTYQNIQKLSKNEIVRMEQFPSLQINLADLFRY